MSVFHRARSSRKTGDLPAIFVHAGAGYHSVANEQVHLAACADAAIAAMALLRSGSSAVEAVEIAIKVLEDREITNAGYGSNLAIDGVVEGDAIVVDHLGRSGGVGAVAQIKNPISLARIVLDLSTQELTLRRVPPNLLVGQGATDFAFEHAVPVLPHDALVSPTAKDRWLRWKQDLKSADKRARQQQSTNPHSPSSSTKTQAPPDDPPPGYEEQVRSYTRREHQKAFKASVWNEGQPISPPASAAAARPPSGVSTGSQASSIDSPHSPFTPAGPDSEEDGPSQGRRIPLTADNLARQTHLSEHKSSLSTLKRVNDANDATRDPSDPLSQLGPFEVDRAMSNIDDHEDGGTIPVDWSTAYSRSPWHDGHLASEDGESGSDTLKLPSITPSPPSSPAPFVVPTQAPEQQASAPQASEPQDSGPQDSLYCQAYDPSNFGRSPLAPSMSSSPRSPCQDESSEIREDCVTDTVGAIAIDCEGNIACGASSGGIGMKYRGRIGPAALVGVGAAVVPMDPDDKTRTCTGAVTSGTGEHMGTTLAAKVCAERLYHGQRKRKGGGFEYCEDDDAVRSMIENDFMEHPSVKHSYSTGAIGVLAVKKSASGTYLYFAHNTDSFALASMHADEPKPTCTMSRSHGNGMLAQGGRSLRYKKKW